MTDHLQYLTESEILGVGIPRLLHLVWVGPNPMPDFMVRNLDMWKKLMPTWTFRLWTNNDIHNGEFPDNILVRIHESNTGVQKCDIMKYFIVEKYGGIYMDADVTPAASLEPIIQLNKKLVLCHDIDVTWGYMSVGFFAAVPHHPVLQRACKDLYVAPLNTGEPHFHTGPGVMGRAFWDTPPTDEKYALLPYKFFYYNTDRPADENFPGSKEFPGKFGTHEYARMWS